MDNKIFLGKYRVSGKEIEAVGEFAGSPLAYEAQEIDSGKKVVVELVFAGSLKMAERERLEAEATAAKKLNHFNIPALYDFGVEDDHLVYVTEDFEGTLAEEWVNTYGPMSAGPVLRIASQVVSALGAAAFHQIIHRAINPGNLVLVAGQTAEGEWPLVKLLHFGGIAPTLSDTGGAVAAFDKSLHYASPEQIQTGTVDFRSEIYSLGCTMWFLLTGVPPLVAPKKSSAVASTAPGGKVSAIPKKVRRLLAQMLSADPEARPGDPLEFYHKLQDCLGQVGRRGAISRRFGVLSFSRGPGDMPGSRWMKPLALAALFLTLATLAALVVPGYLRHRQIVRAEKPIGVPIGVPGTVASVTPAPADAANALASNPTQTNSAVAQSNRPPSASTTSAEQNNTSPLPANAIASNAMQTTSVAAQSNGPPSVATGSAELNKTNPPPTNAIASNPTQTTSTVAQSNGPPSVATGSAELNKTNPPPANAIAANPMQTTSVAAQSNGPPSVAAARAEPDKTHALPPATDPGESGKNQVAMASPQPPATDSLPSSPAQKPAKVATNSPPTATGSSEAASVSRAEASPPPAQSPDRVAQRTARKKFAVREVRRAEPAEPEVRRAEPTSPEEGPDADTPETTASSKPQTNSRAQIEDRRDVENETAESTSRTGKRTDSEPKVATRPRAKSDRPPKPKRWMDERIYPPQPMPETAGPLPPLRRGSVRARFVGVTPDGRWMLAFPSGKIVLVPPPQSFP